MQSAAIDGNGRFIATQTIAGAVLGVVVGGAFAWGVFGGAAAVPLWGPRGLALDLAPTSFMITLMTCLALTLLTRRQVRAGHLRHAPARTRLPRALVLRAPLVAIVATLATVAPTVAVLAMLWTADWSFTATLLFKMAYSAAVAVLVTPPIIRAALAD